MFEYAVCRLISVSRVTQSTIEHVLTSVSMKQRGNVSPHPNNIPETIYIMC